jgi:hypothetical protein
VEVGGDLDLPVEVAGVVARVQRVEGLPPAHGGEKPVRAQVAGPAVLGVVPARVLVGEAPTSSRMVGFGSASASSCMSS